METLGKCGTFTKFGHAGKVWEFCMLNSLEGNYQMFSELSANLNQLILVIVFIGNIFPGHLFRNKNINANLHRLIMLLRLYMTMMPSF